MISFDSLGRMGRLGNQMFQYAAIYAIARRRGFDFCIPPSSGRGLADEPQLAMAFDLAGPAEMALRPYAPRLTESHFHFDSVLAHTCPDNVDIRGFFQSERNFQDCAPEIRREFAFRPEVARLCREALAQLGPEVISLHVRRTDYVMYAHMHPPQDIQYYQRALERAPEGLPVLVFSDDIAWCRAQALFQAPRFSFSEGWDHVHDLCLMSLCRHHIIANSSFSWWGAWLNPAPDKIVIAPTRWMGTEGYVAAHDLRDLVPPGWVRV